MQEQKRKWNKKKCFLHNGTHHHCYTTTSSTANSTPLHSTYNTTIHPTKLLSAIRSHKSKKNGKPTAYNSQLTMLSIPIKNKFVIYCNMKTTTATATTETEMIHNYTLTAQKQLEIKSDQTKPNQTRPCHAMPRHAMPGQAMLEIIFHAKKFLE